jgi:subtilisin family serine protease
LGERGSLCARAALASLAFVLAWAGSAHAARDPATILVRFESGAPPAAARGDRIVARLRHRTVVIRVRAVEAALDRYRTRAGVVYAEPNYLVRAKLERPDDPYYERQWGLSAIHALEGWAFEPGVYDAPSGVTVAILDTGVDPGGGGFGRVDTADAAVCTSGVCEPARAVDENGHGTHIAGIVGARADDGTGGAGVAFSSPILPVKVLDSAGDGSYAAMAAGIAWAVDHGARVINISVGGDSFSRTLCRAVADAVERGVFVAAAAGNDGSRSSVYPAACRGAVGVGATDRDDNHPVWSNTGFPDVFVSAPGVDIFSEFRGGDFAVGTGTSMAAPFVAGLAALLFDQRPSRSVADVRALIAETAAKVGTSEYGFDPFGTCDCTWNELFGYGRIDVAAALGAATASQPAFFMSAAPATATVTSAGSATYRVAFQPDRGFDGAVSLSVPDLPPGLSTTFDRRVMAAGGSAALRVAVGPLAAAGTYELTVVAQGASVTRGATLRLVVRPGDFGVTLRSPVAAVTRGRSATLIAVVTPRHGFAGLVRVSVAGLPRGASAIAAPLAVTNGWVYLRIRTAAATRPGTYRLTVTGRNGRQSHAVGATLVVL